MYVQDVEGTLFLSVPFRNGGVGIAFVFPRPALLVEGRYITAGSEITVRQVPPQEFTRVSFGIPAGDNTPTVETLSGSNGFAVEVSYADLAGNKWISRLDWKPAGGEWELVSSDVRADGRVESVTV